MRIARDLLIIVVIFGGAWWAFTQFSETSENNSIIGVDTEQELGEYLREYVLKRYDSISNPYADSVLWQIKDRLLQKMDTPIYDHKLHIIKSTEVNAFASLGGNIFIFTGLLEYVSGPEELSAVLAHEIAHVEKRHVVKHLIRELGVNSLFMILTGGDQVMVEQISKMVISSSFSREMEKEADDLAVEMLNKADINPNRLAHFFMRLQEKGDISGPLSWVASHPALKDRIERVLKKVDKMEKVEEQPYDIDWSEMLKKLKEN